MSSGSYKKEKEEESLERSGIEYLLRLNKKHSQLFQADALNREQYRALHPTEIGAMKCMDGRIHLPVITKTPLGIIQSWRNIGGRFNLGWYGYQASVWDWIHYSMSRGRNCLIIITDHYSRGSKHRGCRGFDYDEKAAQSFCRGLREQFDHVFGSNIIYTIQCSVETDEEALVFRSKDNGHFLNLAVFGGSVDDLRKELRDLYPDMPNTTLGDLLHLAIGNISHIVEIRKAKRSVAEAEHKEFILAIGRGYDWLHEINTALIVGPFDDNIAGVIKAAANIIKSNLDNGKISSHRGAVLMSSASFRESGPNQRLAEEKAKYLARMGLDVIRSKVPELLPHLHILTATMNMETRGLNVLDRSDSRS